MHSPDDDPAEGGAKVNDEHAPEEKDEPAPEEGELIEGDPAGADDLSGDSRSTSAEAGESRVEPEVSGVVESGPPPTSGISGESPRRRLSIRQVWAVVGGVVSVLSLIVGIISVIPILTRDASSVRSLDASLTAFDPSGMRYFALAADSPLHDFPTGTASTCSADQAAWLSQVGDEVPSLFMVTLRNTAREGAMISVSNVRGQVLPEEVAVGSAGVLEPINVLVECNTSGTGSNLKPANLVLDSGSAFFTNSAGAATQPRPDSPVAYNLAPGEVAQFLLAVRSRGDFDGTIVADVASGKESETIALMDREARLSVRGTFGRSGEFLTVKDGQLACVKTGLRVGEPVSHQGC